MTLLIRRPSRSVKEATDPTPALERKQWLCVAWLKCDHDNAISGPGSAQVVAQPSQQQILSICIATCCAHNQWTGVTTWRLIVEVNYGGSATAILCCSCLPDPQISKASHLCWNYTRLLSMIWVLLYPPRCHACVQYGRSHTMIVLLIWRNRGNVLLISNIVVGGWLLIIRGER